MTFFIIILHFKHLNILVLQIMFMKIKPNHISKYTHLIKIEIKPHLHVLEIYFYGNLCFVVVLIYLALCLSFMCFF